MLALAAAFYFLFRWWPPYRARTHLLHKENNTHEHEQPDGSGDGWLLFLLRTELMITLNKTLKV